MIDQVFPVIRKILNLSYPEARIIMTMDKYDDEYFISINDSNIYNSDEYQDLVLQIKTKLLWPKAISNVFFIIESKDDIHISEYILMNSVDAQINCTLPSANYHYTFSSNYMSNAGDSSVLFYTAA